MFARTSARNSDVFVTGASASKLSVKSRRPGARLLTVAGAIALTAAIGVAMPQPAFAVICDNDDGGAGGTPAGADGGFAVNTACGLLADASAANSGQTAIGFRTTATGAGATAVGGDPDRGGPLTGARALGPESTAVGSNSTAGAVGGSDFDNTAIGSNADAGIGTSADDNTAVGERARAGVGIRADDNTALGEDARAGIGSDADNNTALGQNADAGIGNFADRNTAVGEDARAGIGSGADDNTALGEDASAGTDGTDSNTAIGSNATATGFASTAIGVGATATGPNQVVLGRSTETYTLPGITSPLSRTRQSGPLEVVTTDSSGNLASDGGRTFESIEENTEGIAIALALENPDLKGAEQFGLAFNAGTFEGESAVALAVMGTIADDVFGAGSGVRLALSGGAGYGLDHDNFGGRAGLQLTW